MTGKEITRDFGKKGKDLLVAEWLVWPPAQMINFFLLPTRFRVLFDNTVSLGFDYYYSYVKFKNGDEDSSVKLEEDIVAVMTMIEMMMMSVPKMKVNQIEVNICLNIFVCDIFQFSIDL